MKRIKNHLIAASLIMGALAIPAMAKADAPAATPAPTPAPTPAWYSKVTLGGYADASYLFDVNVPGAYSQYGKLPYQNNSMPYRVFDLAPNAFDYSGEVTLKYSDSASNTGAFVDLIYGNMANVINFNNYNTNIGGSEVGLIIGQAYLTQTLGPVTGTLGKFATPVGYESWNVPSNANFSRGLLYSQEPFYQEGLKLDYAAPMSIVASLWLDDGNSIETTLSNAKNMGAVLAYSGINNLNLTGVFYKDLAGGYSNTTAGKFDYTNTGDFIATYTVNSALNVAGEYLDQQYFQFDGIVFQQQGYALYATYALGNLSISPRFEQWFTPYGANTTNFSTTPRYELSDYTLTLKYPMGPISHMLEYRSDASNAAEFSTTGSLNSGKTPSYIDQTITYAAVYSF